MDETIALDSIQAIAASFGASFDAEKIVDTVVEKDGTQYYKVRWVKYSWEPAASFAHLEHLIRDFWNQFGGIPDNIQDLSSERNEPNRIIQKQLTAQVISSSRESIVAGGNSNLQNNIPSSILNSVSTIVNNDVAQSKAEDVHHIALQETQLTTDSVVNQDDDDVLSDSEHRTAVQEMIGGAETHDEMASHENKNDINGEPKKRRKIPGSCTICGKHFKSTTNIAAHRKLHTEEKQYECNECGRKFRRKLHLVRHKESHAGIKSYVCNICGNNFSSKWYMQAHALIHSGDKPYQCDVCQKSFNNKANLNKHRLIHENNRPFVCNQCGRSYRQSYDLKRHMSTHSVVKNFSCTYCDRSFTMKSYLQRHIQTHVGDKKFTCELCPAKFFQRGHLNYHIKQHHEKIDCQENDNNMNSKVVQNDDLLENKNNLNESVVDKLHEPNHEDMNDENSEFFTSHNDSDNQPIVFLSTNNSEFDNSTTQIVTAKQIYQEAYDGNNPQHNISIAVSSNSLPQKCLIIETNQLVEKHGVILSNCIKNTNENQLCLENEVQTLNNDLIDHENLHTDDSIQSAVQVGMSVLTSDHTIFNEQGVLELQKDTHMYL